MFPMVVIHNAVSLDGRITGFTPDIGLYYRLAATWAEDATLAGSQTILAAAAEQGIADDEMATGPRAGERARRVPPRLSKEGARIPRAAPLLAVPDSRGRIRCWSWLLSQPYWSEGVALCTRATPEIHLDYLAQAGVHVILAGEERVDLRSALAELHRDFGVLRVRVDGGGSLNGALLGAGLVDEISLLVHPVFVGDAASAPLYRRPDGVPEGAGAPNELGLESLSADPQDGGLLWLRYQIPKKVS